jgi:hypothetical protein
VEGPGIGATEAGCEQGTQGAQAQRPELHATEPIEPDRTLQPEVIR